MGRISLRVAPIQAALLLPAAILLCIGIWAQASPDAASRALVLRRVVNAAVERTHHSVRYDPRYVRIPYPDGDVSADTGVCTDEIIRVYRAVGVDLQKKKCMKTWSGTSRHIRQWNLARPDTNIDHRRVANLMVFFQRKGESLPTTTHREDYEPGDLVTYDGLPLL